MDSSVSHQISLDNTRGSLKAMMNSVGESQSCRLRQSELDDIITETSEPHDLQQRKLDDLRIRADFERHRQSKLRTILPPTLAGVPSISARTIASSGPNPRTSEKTLRPRMSASGTRLESDTMSPTRSTRNDPRQHRQYCSTCGTCQHSARNYPNSDRVCRA
jgi:hypothetical protein